MGREQRRRQAAEAARLQALPRRMEWVGGRFAAPFYVTEGEPYRPEMTLWLEMPDDLVVHHHLIGRGQPEVSFGETLRNAMRSPLVGPPRKPNAVRVADPDLAAEVRRVLPAAEVVVAPTPELDRILELMGRDMEAEAPGGETASYFENGRVSPAAVQRLFESAKILFTAAPWKVASDSQLVRLDIPDLGVRGACISIIGALGESLGLTVFPSIDAHDAFVSAAESRGRSEGPLDLGTDVLVLTFERGADLSPTMHREALEHGWPVAAPDAYPVVTLREADGVCRPLSERELHIVSACAVSFSSFFFMKREIFLREELDDPVCHAFAGKDDIEVRFTYPYPAWPEFEVNPPPPVGRDALVWSPEVASPPMRGSAAPSRQSDPVSAGGPPSGGAATISDDEDAFRTIETELVKRMIAFAEIRFRKDWRRVLQVGLASPPVRRITTPCALYHAELQGCPVVDRFFEEERPTLSGPERSWLEAQRAAWLSIWEALEVDEGRSVLLRDLLTGETRRVLDLVAAETLLEESVVLARVVDFNGLSFLSGLHGAQLFSEDGAEVAERVRRHMRRKRTIPPERLRDETIVRYMVARWNEAVEADARETSGPFRLTNTEGHPLRFTVDSFGFDSRDRGEIRKHVASLEGVEEAFEGGVFESVPFGGLPTGVSMEGVSADRVSIEGAPVERAPFEGAEDGPSGARRSELVYRVVKPSDPERTGLETVVIAAVHISDDVLEIQTNSIERADELRERLESALAGRIRHRSREHADRHLEDIRARIQDVRSEARAAGRVYRGGARQGGFAARMAEQVSIRFKDEYYATWPDHPLPNLDGRTPREAAQTAEGRHAVDLLLKDMKDREAGLPKRERFDFSRLREELGLGE